MSRYRTKSIATGGSQFCTAAYSYQDPTYGRWYFWTNKPWVNSPTYTDDAGSVSFASKAYEEMTDENAKTGGHPYNPCYHRKVVPAFFPKSAFTYSGSKWSSGYWYYLDVTGMDVWIRPSNWAPIWSQLESALTSHDWYSQVVALASLVRGLVESRSLLAVSLQELPKTIRMVRNPFGLLKTNWRQLAKGFSASKLAKTGANLWLEYQYGWNAAHYDLSNFSVALAKWMVNRDHINFYRAGERFSKASETLLSVPSPTVADGLWSEWLQTLEDGGAVGSSGPRARIVFGTPLCKFNISCFATEVLTRWNQLEKFMFAYGLDADHLLETIWEVVPYSFVVDWFVNISELIKLPRYLDSIRTLHGTNVRQLGFTAKAVTPFTAQIATRHCSGNWTNLMSYAQTNQTKSHLVSRPGEISIFQRSAGIPSSCGSVFSNQGLSVKQGVSGFSLLLQRIRER